jgi:hypothetical protein
MCAVLNGIKCVVMNDKCVVMSTADDQCAQNRIIQANYYYLFLNLNLVMGTT